MNFFKFLSCLFLLICLLALNSCLLTTRAEIQINESKVKYQDGSKIYLEFEQSEEIKWINGEQFFQLLKEKMSNYKRYPAFQLTRRKEEADCQIKVSLNRVDFKQYDTDLTEEEQKKQDQIHFNRKLEAIRKGEPFDEKKVVIKKYVITSLDFTYYYQIELADQEGQSFALQADGRSQKTIVKTDRRESPRKTLIQTADPLSFFLVSMTQSFFEELSRFTSESIAVNAYPGKTRRAIKKLIRQLSDDMSQTYLLLIDTLLYRYVIDRIYLLPINREIDSFLIQNLKQSQKMITYLLKNADQLENDQKARCYYNISLLYKYQLQKKAVQTYYEKAKALPQARQTARQYQSISRFIQAYQYSRAGQYL